AAGPILVAAVCTDAATRGLRRVAPGARLARIAAGVPGTGHHESPTTEHEQTREEPGHGCRAYHETGREVMGLSPSPTRSRRRDRRPGRPAPRRAACGGGRRGWACRRR